MAQKIKFEDKTVFFKTQPVVFNFPIGEVLERENIVIVRLNIPKDNPTRKNIFALDYNAKFLWQVQPMKEVEPSLEESRYLAMKDSPNGNITATDSNGYMFEINPQDGKIVKFKLY